MIANIEEVRSKKITENLYLVDLDQPLEGFRKFISAWIYTPDDLTILVDPGPRSTIPLLLSALKKQEVKKIDYILLTHIHIDHAGGTGLLLKRYPQAQVICHPKAIRHMIAPGRLWESSRKILGDLAEAYGEIAPVPEKSIGYQEHIKAGEIVIAAIPTPGHAAHHLCYQAGEILFAGEVAGVTYPLEEALYLRLATPPALNYEVYRNSLDKAAALPVSRICFGHYGSREDVKNVFATAFVQLDNWLAVVEKRLRAEDEPSEESIFSELLRNDQGLPHYGDLPYDIQARERYFSLNSIRGILLHISSLPSSPKTSEQSRRR
ncbi:MAG: MBL fold metallo-hydrolase [Syntrophales bacterium]|nr:MBL fold metallo-hydrolase [Syntrophales bacterium]